MERLGDRIRRLRQAKGWPQNELARRAHLDPSDISRLETGAITRPRNPKVQALAAALGVSAQYLRSGDPDVATAALRPLPRTAAQSRISEPARGSTRHIFQLLTEVLPTATAGTRETIVLLLEALHAERDSMPPLPPHA